MAKKPPAKKASKKAPKPERAVKLAKKIGKARKTEMKVHGTLGTKGRAQRDDRTEPKKPEAPAPAEAKASKVTNKKDAAKASRQRKARAVAEAVKDKAKKYETFTDTTLQLLYQQVGAIRTHQADIEDLKPQVAELKAQVAEEKTELVEAAEDKTLTREKKGAKLESVGKDFKKHEASLNAKKTALAGHREGLKAGFEKLLTTLEEVLFGDMLPYAAGGKRDITQAPGETGDEGDEDDEHDDEGMATEAVKIPEMGKRYIFTSTRKPTEGKKATVLVTELRDRLVTVKVEAADVADMVGQDTTFPWDTGTWATAPAQAEKAPASPAPSSDAPKPPSSNGGGESASAQPPETKIVPDTEAAKGKPPEWFSKEIDSLKLPETLKASLKAAGFVTIGDVMAKVPNKGDRRQWIRTMMFNLRISETHAGLFADACDVLDQAAA